MKFVAIVTLCGLYQGHVDACLEQTDRAKFATRSACIARSQEMRKTADTAFWYARIKAPYASKIRCVEAH